MSKTEKQIDQARQILKRHVFNDESFWRFNVGLKDGILEIQVAPRHVETVRSGLDEFFAKHAAHPLKGVPVKIEGNTAHEPAWRGSGRSLQLGLF
jgi:hypothetical protein